MKSLHCFIGDCDFEDFFLCEYIQAQNDDFDWIRGHGSTRTNRTGPKNDHTKDDQSGEAIIFLIGHCICLLALSHILACSLYTLLYTLTCLHALLKALFYPLVVSLLQSCLCSILLTHSLPLSHSLSPPLSLMCSHVGSPLSLLLTNSLACWYVWGGVDVYAYW